MNVCSLAPSGIGKMPIFYQGIFLTTLSNAMGYFFLGLTACKIEGFITFFCGSTRLLRQVFILILLSVAIKNLITWFVYFSVPIWKLIKVPTTELKCVDKGKLQHLKIFIFFTKLHLLLKPSFYVLGQSRLWSAGVFEKRVFM